MSVESVKCTRCHRELPRVAECPHCRTGSELASAAGSRFDTRIVIFAVYSILYEIIIWGLFGWAVFVRGESGWWILAAAYLSCSQLKPRHFGIPEKNSANEKGEPR